MQVNPITLRLDKIRLDGGTQTRTSVDMKVVNEYACAYSEGATFPAIDVFYDGHEYWLADGFHRYFGAQEANVAELLATSHEGTQRDAILFAAGANATYGLKRANEDKRRAVETLLRDAEWGTWSDRHIAKQCGVSHTFVERLRSKTNGNVAIVSERQFLTSTGKMSTRSVSRRPNDDDETISAIDSPER